MSIIPTHVLLPLAALILVMIVFGIETAWYYAFAAWYYRSGPAIVRERWQTMGTVDQVRDAIRPQLTTEGLVGRESDEGFCIRQKTVSANAWPRILLRIENTERGAALRYEVRPYYTMALLALPVVWLAMSAFNLAELGTYLTVGIILCLAGIYKWILPWDIRRINRLPSIRRALAPFGLRVCEKCGYDLFGHDEPLRCPECGWARPA
jgi:hypothetical protein